MYVLIELILLFLEIRDIALKEGREDWWTPRPLLRRGCNVSPLWSYRSISDYLQQIFHTHAANTTNSRPTQFCLRTCNTSLLHPLPRCVFITPCRREMNLLSQHLQHLLLDGWMSVIQGCRAGISNDSIFTVGQISKTMLEFELRSSCTLC